MYPRTNYEMTQEDCDALLAAMKSVPYMVIGGHAPRSQQENANAAWDALGKKMGFDYMTVQPIDGKGMLFFSAIPSENEAQRTERVAKEKETQRQSDIKKHEDAISEHLKELAKLNGAS